jgi:nitrogen regulatory protein PII
MTMELHPMKLVTIVCEAYAQAPVIALLGELNAQGWTSFSVEGDGARGKRPSDIREFSNIQIEVIVRPEVSQRLLEQLERELFPRYGMIAFESDIRVLRRDKF